MWFFTCTTQPIQYILWTSVFKSKKKRHFQISIKTILFIAFTDNCSSVNPPSSSSQVKREGWEWMCESTRKLVVRELVDGLEILPFDVILLVLLLGKCCVHISWTIIDSYYDWSEQKTAYNSNNWLSYDSLAWDGTAECKILTWQKIEKTKQKNTNNRHMLFLEGQKTL